MTLRNLCSLVAVLLGVALLTPADGASTGFLSPNLSYSFGSALPNSVICTQTVVPIGTVLPFVVTSSGAATVNQITLTADKFSKIGFLASITAGSVKGISPVSVTINGKSVLPYNIAVKFYC